MSSNSEEDCPLCDLPKQEVETTDFGQRKHLVCRRCGEVRITTTAAERAKQRGIAAALSAWLRARFESRVEVLEVSSQNLDEVISFFPKYSIVDKQMLLLRWVAGRSAFPGDQVALDPKLDYPVAWCGNDVELNYHLESLEQRHLASISRSPYLESTSVGVVIAPEGWSHLDQAHFSRSNSDQAFVAMAFADELRPAWEDGIRKAVTRAGYRPFRTDAQPSIDRIDMQIMSEIRQSRFVIADVTLQRQGVYFEAGFAIGLGIPVYWCVRDDEKDKVHFDTRQYNHIVWSTPVDLEAKLFDFIHAIAGPASAT